MPRLYVNLDHVATLREARGTPYPELGEAISMVEAAGCVQGITLHLREDRRHIHDRDVQMVRQITRLPFNFELSVAPDIIARCLEVRPAQATLVPERRLELTTEGGLDLVALESRLRTVTERLQAQDILVSLFIDPERDMLRRARDLGATHVELHTGCYANAGPEQRQVELEKLLEAAEIGRSCGLKINAGHGLTAQNVGPVAAIPELLDLNIGHAIVAQALFVGLREACLEMARAITQGAAS